MKTTIFSKTTIGALAVCSLLLSACRGDGGFDYDHSALYVSGTDENPVVKFVVEDTPASYAVTVQSTEKVASDVKLLMAIDRSKVAEYNEANKTKRLRGSYKAVVEFAGGSAGELRAVSGRFIPDKPDYPVPVLDTKSGSQQTTSAPAAEGTTQKGNG